jgi:pyruvate dehydrogenase E2 component (dihydrolipoamide acetyltransferase)
VFHATAKIWCDPLLTLKEQLRQGAGTAVTINDIIVKGCALALRRCPDVNATFHGELVRLHEDVDVAVAVAVEGGLITPIVRNADAKGLVQLSAEIAELCGRAQAGTLSRSDYEGGTFTVSNLGMHGLEQFTAIINPPQCAILAVGAVEHELYLDAGIARERRVLRATLSSDHRVIDGALAARFLGELRSILDNPACLLV